MLQLSSIFAPLLSAARQVRAAVGFMGFEGTFTPQNDLESTIFALMRRDTIRHVTVRQRGL